MGSNGELVTSLSMSANKKMSYQQLKKSAMSATKKAMSGAMSAFTLAATSDATWHYL